MATRVQIIISATASAAVSAFRAVTSALRRVATTAGQAAPYALMAGKVLVAVAAVTALTGALGNLLGAVLLVAPAAAAGGLAMLGFKLALNGVQDALEAGLSGDVEKFEKALAKLAPQAADAVRQLVKLRDEWKPLVKDFQGRVFQGAAAELRGLNSFIKPIADRWLPKLAMRFAEVRNEIAEGIARYAADGRLEKVWENVHGAVSNLLGAVKPLARAFGDILSVAAPHLNQLTAGVDDAAQRFADWIRKLKDDGTLDEWIRKARDGFGKLKEIATSLGTAVMGIMGAGEESGQTMLDNIVKWTKEFSSWVNSGDGQKAIKDMTALAAAISDAAPALKLVLDAINFQMGAFTLLKEVAIEAWNAIVSAVQFSVNGILGYMSTMLAAGVAAFGWIPGIGDKLKAAQAKFEEFRNNVNNTLNGIKKNVDIVITTHYRQVGRQSTSGDRPVSGSGLRFNHSGGHPRGMSWVGEYGPELVDFGAQGRVYNNGQSMRMAAAAGGGGAVTVTFGTPAAGDHFANAVLEMVRTGRIPLKVTSSGRVKPA